MTDIIGIDAGGTRMKAAYMEDGKISTKVFPIDELEKAAAWLSMLKPQASFAVTGGRAKQLESILGSKMEVVSEFHASCKGIKHLLLEEKITIDSFIFVVVGTGTSIHLIQKDSHERLAGSGLGGGTIAGLGSLLTGQTSYSRLGQMAKSGDRKKVDLLVRDIYSMGESPLPDELTAANFGKAGEGSHHDDSAAALTTMVAETIILLVTMAAEKHGTQHIVFAGGAMDGNPLLAETLEQYKNMLGYVPYFPARGMYSGAIGAMLIGGRNVEV